MFIPLRYFQAKAIKFTFDDLVADDIMVRTVFNVEGSVAAAQVMPTGGVTCYKCCHVIKWVLTSFIRSLL